MPAILISLVKSLYVIPPLPPLPANHYLLKYPREEYTTGRKLRCSPLHARLETAGAVFGETMAYERPMYFQDPDDGLCDSF